MELTDIFLTQMTDLFRIGLVVFLVLTAANTAPQMGYAIPLVLGVVFIAILIPTSLGAQGASIAVQIAVGLVSNSIILGLVFVAKAVVLRLAGTRPRR